jgi:hypothetical protein
MKTINEFFGSDENIRVLTMAELKLVKGGDEPVGEQTYDPFKKK